MILKKGRIGEVYNIGGGSECENIQLVTLLCDVADQAFRANADLRAGYPQCPPARGGSAASLIRYVTDRAGHDRRYAIDCGKIERELGYRAHTVLETGLRDTFDWYLRNPAWWQAVMDGSYRQWIAKNYAI